MTSLLYAAFASLLYLVASWYLVKCFRTPSNTPKRIFIMTSATFGLVLHTISLTLHMFTQEAMLFGFGNSLSLIAWVGVVLLLIISSNKPTESLGIFVLPIAAVSVFMPLVIPADHTINYTIGSHVVISLLAYSVLGIATAQAVLFRIQERRFKQNKLGMIIRSLPPLQLMGATMMQLLFIGYALLTLTLITGILFIENIFGQHLAHKTFFTIIAWIIYSLFLWGHFRFGWRGRIATRFIIWAYTFLLLAYVGTQTIFLFIN